MSKNSESSEEEFDSKNYVSGDNIVGIVGDKGKVKVKKVEVVKGDKLKIIRDNDTETEISPSDPFYKLYMQAQSSDKGRKKALSEIDSIRTEVEKGDKANESFLIQRLKNLQKMAPDLFEVATTMLISPVSGFTTVIKKIAEKAKAEAKQH